MCTWKPLWLFMSSFVYREKLDIFTWVHALYAFMPRQSVVTYQVHTYSHSSHIDTTVDRIRVSAYTWLVHRTADKFLLAFGYFHKETYGVWSVQQYVVQCSNGIHSNFVKNCVPESHNKIVLCATVYTFLWKQSS